MRREAAGATIEQLSARAFDDAPAGLALASIADDNLGRLIAVNRALQEITGRDAAELLDSDHRARLRLLGARRDTAERNARLFSQLAHGEIEGYTEVVEVVHARGNQCWLEANVGLVHDGLGAPVCALLHVVDVTERELLARRLEARRAAVRALGQVETASSALSALPSALGPAFGAVFAAVWVPEASSGALRARAVWEAEGGAGSFAGASRTSPLNPGEGLPGSAFAQQRCLTGPDLRPDDPRLGERGAHPLRGMAAVPIMLDSEPVAVLEFGFAHPVPRGDVFIPTLKDLASLAEELVGRAWAEERRSPSRELLLVEDNEFIARLVREMLVSSYDESLALVHARTLGEAYEQLVSTRPSCVLLDLNLPDSAGIETLTDLRRRAPEVPVVVLTAEEDEDLALRAVKEGAQDYLMKRKVDMHGLARAIRYAIERKGVEQSLLSHRLRHPLTHLPTRVLFLDQLRVALSTQKPGQVAVLVVDIDRFRIVNDSLGHDAGDCLLVEVARRLVAAAGPGGTVASLGGDTFAVLLAGEDAEFAAVALAGRICSAVAEPFLVEDQELVSTATVGVALNGDPSIRAETLLGDADTAMSRAKEAGGSQWQFYEEGVRAGLRDELRLEGDLRAGIERNELRLHYQPIIALGDSRLVAFEALVRWDHPERGLLGAGEFVPLAERSGLIVALGSWVLRNACAQLRDWRAASEAFGSVAVHVNLAAAQLRQPTLVEEVLAVLREHQLAPSDLCLEITETAVIEKFECAVETLQALKAHGVWLALDDFGTGYSSLSYLSRLPVDSIKLDRSFLVAAREAQEPAIVALVGSMATALSLPAVAEGIEAEDDIARLLEFGYTYGQGYWLGAPEPPAAAVGMVDEAGLWKGVGR